MKSSLGLFLFTVAGTLYAQSSNAEILHPCSRHPAVKRAILAAVNKDCRVIVFSDLLNIADLKVKVLDSESSTRIESTDFEGLGIKTLQVQGKAFFAENAFSSVKSSIVEIKLVGVHWDAPPPKLLSSLSELKTISIESNQVESLPEAFFANLSSLESVSIAGARRIPRLSSRLFEGSNRIKYVDFLSKENVGNYLRSDGNFPDDLFRHLVSLENIFLAYRPGQQNLAIRLPKHAFCGMTSLQEAKIDGAFVGDLDLFCSDVPLTKLSITYLAPDQSNALLLCDVPKLKYLDLSFSRDLKSIGDFLCGKTDTLQEMSLSGDSNINLENATALFRKTPHLENLSLYNIDVDDVGALQSLTELKRMALRKTGSFRRNLVLPAAENLKEIALIACSPDLPIDYFSPAQNLETVHVEHRRTSFAERPFSKNYKIKKAYFYADLDDEDLPIDTFPNASEIESLEILLGPSSSLSTNHKILWKNTFGNRLTFK